MSAIHTLMASARTAEKINELNANTVTELLVHHDGVLAQIRTGDGREIRHITGWREIDLSVLDTVSPALIRMASSLGLRIP